VGASADAMLADKSPSAAVTILLNSFPETNLIAVTKFHQLTIFGISSRAILDQLEVEFLNIHFRVPYSLIHAQVCIPRRS
jgi:hypothetical protein